jgi:5-formyltetrahydrofolate cyclo-ligase
MTTPDPNSILRNAKTALRSRISERLRALPEDERRAASQDACARLVRQTPWARAHSILFYAPVPGELDVWPLVALAFALQKNIFLPRYDAASQRYVACRITSPELDLSPGKFGIREPLSSCALAATNRLDLLLVPGVAFDLHGRRLGRGKGFYDRLLSAMRGTRCGVGFDEQIIPEVPAEPHDVVLNCILTPTRWIEL